MKRADNIKRLIKKSHVTAGPDADERILGGALADLEKLGHKRSARSQPNIWRVIGKSKITKFAAGLAVVLIVLCGVIVLDQIATPAWAIEQTVEALENICSLVICGTDYWGSEPVPFKFCIRFSEDDSKLFDMRFESEKQIIVVRDTKAWAYWDDENVVKIYEDVTTSEGMMRDLRFWYKIAQLNPWITGKMFAVLKSFADDWQETYGKDERTGRDGVFVTCSYKPLSTSYWFVCDLENKLILEGKYWRNSNREGPPVCHAMNFTYNEEIKDEIFSFEIPEGAKVIEKSEEADALFEQAKELFHEKKQYAEAITIYWQVYDKYPDLKIAEESLMMIGICYDHMGQYEKAIEAYEKAIREYPNLKGWIESTYCYLGFAYMETGQKEKAVEAFQNCILMGEGIRDSNKFPLKHARECIEKLKNQE